MTRYTDGKNTIGITMHQWTGDGWTPDWQNDFFDGVREYSEDNAGNIAYFVKDVNYMVDCLIDYMEGVGDFVDARASENECVDIYVIKGAVSPDLIRRIESCECAQRITIV